MPISRIFKLSEHNQFRRKQEALYCQFHPVSM